MINKNIMELFHKQFNVSTKLDEKFAEIVNQKSFEEGKNFLNSIGAKCYLEDGNYCILYAINELTKKTTDDKQKNEMLELIKRQKDVTEVKVEINEKTKVSQLVIKRGNEKIKVMKLSELAPKLLEIIPDLEDSRREGTCFDKTYYISINSGFSHDIVTGYIYGISDKSKFLHSWIETKAKGEDIVIDGPLNAVINKEGYYKLRRVEEIKRITSDTFVDDIKKYLKHSNGIFPLEVYYVFRDEIIDDLKKNDKLFK